MSNLPCTGHGNTHSYPRTSEDDRRVPPLIGACPEDLECQVCHDVADNPTVTEECGHLFCYDCIQRSIVERNACPICRRALTMASLRRDIRSQRRIHALPCTCHNAEQGCSWSGSIGDLPAHLATCDHGHVACPFAAHGCAATKLTRQQLNEHIQTNMSLHLLMTCEAVTRLRDDHAALQQELDLSIQRSHNDTYSLLAHHESGSSPSMGRRLPAAIPQNVVRFIWVIPNFEIKGRDPLYSRKFFAKGFQWYLGVDFDDARSHAGVYLFAEDHQMRVNFKLVLYHHDPTKDVVHVVNDWSPEYKGKGWGPLRFVDMKAMSRLGFYERGCARIGVEMDGEPFD